jgi:hypothetical protein
VPDVTPESFEVVFEEDSGPGLSEASA